MTRKEAYRLAWSGLSLAFDILKGHIGYSVHTESDYILLVLEKNKRDRIEGRLFVDGTMEVVAIRNDKDCYTWKERFENSRDVFKHLYPAWQLITEGQNGNE